VLAVNVALAGAARLPRGATSSEAAGERRAVQPSIEDVAAAPASQPIDVSKYRETLERPLFAATPRKVGPRKDAAAEEEAAADALKDVRLLGLTVQANGGGIIGVQRRQGSALPVGEGIGGWKGGRAGRAQRELVRADGQRRKLELALNSVAPASAAPKGGAPEPPRRRPAVPAQPTDAAGPAASAARRGCHGRLRARLRPWGRCGAGGKPGGAAATAERINQRRAARGLAADGPIRERKSRMHPMILLDRPLRCAWAPLLGLPAHLHRR